MNPVRAKITPSVHDEYSALAHSYERRWQRYLEISTTRTLAALDPRNGETILDAGCGTGLLLRRIAAHAPGAHLVGVDLTLPMIRRADSKTSGLVVGDVCCLPLADASLDAVAFASVFHYLPSLDPALSEAARVLRPGGRVVITVWDAGNRRTRMLGRWLQWRNATNVYLHQRPDLIASCNDHRLAVRREQAYAAGVLWHLFTIVGIKNADHG